MHSIRIKSGKAGCDTCPSTSAQSPTGTPAGTVESESVAEGILHTQHVVEVAVVEVSVTVVKYQSMTSGSVAK
jgi:hypothetical protein